MCTSVGFTHGRLAKLLPIELENGSSCWVKVSGGSVAVEKVLVPPVMSVEETDGAERVVNVLSVDEGIGIKEFW